MNQDINNSPDFDPHKKKNYLNSSIWRVAHLFSLLNLQQNLLVETSLVLEKAWRQEYEEHPNVPFTEYIGRGINNGMTRNQEKKSSAYKWQFVIENVSI